jgi:CubicO group peptidase (beta-lactamase class C family)
MTGRLVNPAPSPRECAYSDIQDAPVTAIGARSIQPLKATFRVSHEQNHAPVLTAATSAPQGAPSMIGAKTMNRSWCGRPPAICAVGIAVAVVTLAPSVSAAEFSAADGLMLRLMSMDNVPGAALALIKGGNIVLERGYGFRDLVGHDPVTTTTLFNIGSISKSFTALGVAQLVDQHQVDLDAPVIRYIPDLRLSDPQATQAVTVRQLLSHASGLPSDEQWPQQVPATRDGIVSEFASMPITAQPGTRFQYCSRCIVLAAYIIERVTGQSWEAYTREHIFEPLGMTTASFGPRGLEQAPDRAQPYRHDGVLRQMPVPWSRLQYLEPLGPGGGIDASIDEMARYALLQLDDGTMFGDRILSTQMMAELHRPEIDVGVDWRLAARAENLHYALGWFTADVRGVHIVFHNGENPGFRAAVVLAPSSKAGVVVLTNGESKPFIEMTTRSLLEQLLR